MLETRVLAKPKIIIRLLELSGWLAIITLANLIIGILLVFHGPFVALKELYVTTAMTTYTHQYLAQWFVNKTEIERIMAKNRIQEPSENTNEKAIMIDERLIKRKSEIEYFEINRNNFRGHLLKVSNPKNISLSASDNLGRTGMKVSDFARKQNAVAAINAGGFADVGGIGTGGTPTGLLMVDGKILYKDNLDKYSIIGFDRNNIMVLGKYTLREIEEMGVRDAVNFGPFIVVNGEPMIKYGDGGWGIAPRTAIGQTKDGAILLLVIDGRQISSIGATLRDLQDIMLEYGAQNAANLDGGSSTTMYYNGQVINKPSSPDGPRDVPSAFVVKLENSFLDENVPVLLKQVSGFEGH